MNNVTLLGTLTKDVELRYLPSGSALANLSLAHNKRFKRADGEYDERVLYVKASCFGKTAEVINQYFKKGSRILIQGELVLNTWTDNNGNNRQEHSILIEKINFVDKKNQEQTKQAPQETKIIYEQSGETQVIQNNNKNTAVIDIGDDEIPF
ncbi:single-stranded DNA-binding protein [Helicobacter pullorum NCTC 12824]|uniref:single-stranded DNA-binding protein n=1 Tax=Helicobacter pullorum TaxID=35818 RepID=UPI001246C748|nr:single-stranded DNA-binding protein [Helicobacter pullorum]KAB0574526.1 single-stranded DNA-binding protein [Helicobacter pullorum NCTC 12824]